jgi:DNA-binding PadR family transcriptional regulator
VMHRDTPPLEGRRMTEHPTPSDLGRRGHSWFRYAMEHGRGLGGVRRGAVRVAILATLRDEPMHGYQIIQTLEQRTNGRWRPSAGSIYPTLQLLEDEGLVHAQDVDGRKTYGLTDAGRAAAAESPLARHPFAGQPGGNDGPDLRRLALDLVGAAVQVRRIGSPQANAAARDILVDSRKRLYRLLADDEHGGGDTA